MRLRSASGLSSLPQIDAANKYNAAPNDGMHPTAEYGLIAGAVAQLTEGFIFSRDGAWEADGFPATADELFSWYFRPELATRAYYKQKAERDLKRIAEGTEDGPISSDKSRSRSRLKIILRRLSYFLMPA